MDKLTYASQILIEEINAELERTHKTRAQLAQMCDVPESTLTKVLNHSSKNPAFDTLAPAAHALGISTDEALKKAIDHSMEVTASSTTVPAKMLVSQEDKFLNLFIETHEKQIYDLRRQCDHKDKWIKALVGIIIAFTAILASVALLAITHHDIGLIKAPAAIFQLFS